MAVYMYSCLKKGKHDLILLELRAFRFFGSNILASQYQGSLHIYVFVPYDFCFFFI